MINCIVAVEKNRGIGFRGQLPWPRLTNDMKWFKNKTVDQIVVMGRKTWESIGSKNLPGRINIVISRSTVQNCHLNFSTPAQSIEFCRNRFPRKEIFIIGGSAIYQEFLKSTYRFYITEIDANYHCDTFFDLDYVKSNFKNVTEIASFDDPVKYTIKEYNV